MKFKVGDEVIVVEGGSGVHPDNKGKKTVITEVGGVYGHSSCEPGVKTKDFKNPGYDGWISERTFEKVDRIGFQIEDRVKIKEDCEFASQSQAIGTIKSSPDGRGWMRVEFDDGYRNTFQIKHLIKIKERKRKIQKKVIKVNQKIHNKFAKELKEFQEKQKMYPVCYLLGKNKQGVITNIEHLEPARHIDSKQIRGCSGMIYIKSETIAKAYFNLIKKRTISCGLAKISNRIDKGYYGPSIKQINEGFTLTFGKNFIDIFFYNHKTHTIERDYQYAIVK